MKTTVLRALLWKDYRQNRLLFIAGLIMLVMGTPTIWLMAWLTNRAITLSSVSARDMLEVAFPVVMLTSALIVAMLGGTIIAADRADRSAAFLACLPPSRRMVLLSKALCAGSAICPILIINITLAASSLLLDMYSRNVAALPWRDILFVILITCTTGLLLFGTAWFAGSLLGSPAIASVIAIGFPMVLGVVLFMVEIDTSMPRNIANHLREIYCAIAGVLGLAFFTAGCLHSLYRKADI